MKIMRVGNDLGYGAVKASLNDTNIIQPSIIAPIEQTTSDPVNHADTSEVERVISNIFNQLDVVVNNKRYLVGEAAKNTTLDRIIFDTNSKTGKAHTELSKVLILSFIAAQAVKEAYENGEDIFSPLKVEVGMTTALPINEIGITSLKNDVREEYANSFLNKNHIVIFKNFDYDISVTINFKNVKVFKEGEVATVVAIKHGSQEVENALLSDFKKNYPERTKEGKKILHNSNDVLGIDIGQGTTDFALTVSGAGDVYNSTSIPQGYGTVLHRAWQYLPRLSNGFTVKDTVAFQKLLESDPTTKIAQENKEFALAAEKTSTSTLVSKIVETVNFILSVTDHLDVIYIFGGGSIPIMERTDLRKQLEESLRNYRSDAAIIWAGKQYSQYLNSIGLKTLAETMKID